MMREGLATVLIATSRQVSGRLNSLSIVLSFVIRYDRDDLRI